MLRELGDKHQAEPPLSTALGDAGHLLEEVRQFVDALLGEELVGLLDDDQGLRRLRAGRFGLAVGILLRTLYSSEDVCDDQVVQRRRVGVG